MRKIQGWFENLWDNMKTLLKFLGGAPCIELYPPTRLEKKIKRRRALAVILVITALALWVYVAYPEVLG